MVCTWLLLRSCKFRYIFMQFAVDTLCEESFHVQICCRFEQAHYAPTGMCDETLLVSQLKGKTLRGGARRNYLGIVAACPPLTHKGLLTLTEDPVLFARTTLSHSCTIVVNSYYSPLIILPIAVVHCEVVCACATLIMNCNTQECKQQFDAEHWYNKCIIHAHAISATQAHLQCNIIYDVCPGYASNVGKSGGMCPIDTKV